MINTRLRLTGAALPVSAWQGCCSCAQSMRRTRWNSA